MTLNFTLSILEGDTSWYWLNVEHRVVGCYPDFIVILSLVEKYYTYRCACDITVMWITNLSSVRENMLYFGAPYFYN